MDTLYDHGREQVFKLHGLLYITPSAATSKKPNIDLATMKVTAALRANLGTIFTSLGFRECACGVWSNHEDLMVPGGFVTHSLCVHYLAYHRDEVPEEMLAKIARLKIYGYRPNERELRPPPQKKS
jgi:hypothetical protein